MKFIGRPARCLNKPLASWGLISAIRLSVELLCHGKGGLADRTDYAEWQIWECLNTGSAISKENKRSRPEAETDSAIHKATKVKFSPNLLKNMPQEYGCPSI